MKRVQTPHRMNFTTWQVVALAAVLASFFFLRPFLGIIALGALAAYLFSPLFARLKRLLGGSANAAAAATTVASLVVVFIPLVLVALIAFNQAVSLLAQADIGIVGDSDLNLNEAATRLAGSLNAVIERVSGIEEAVSEEQAVQAAREALPGILSAGRDILLGVVGGIPGFIVLAVIYIFVFTGFLVNQDGFLRVLRALSPFTEEDNDRYLERMGAMARSMVKGQLLIAFLQALVGALSLLVVGFGEYFFLLVVLFTFMNLVPLGSGIITIPVGIILLLMGRVPEGLFVLFTHFVVVTNIDNLRPRLVDESARMPAAFTILGAFAGVAWFGLLGVIYGPIIMIVLVTTFQLYRDQEERRERRAANG